MKQHLDEDRVDRILSVVRAELLRATDEFGPFNSPHEGYAILKEEVEELWSDIKGDEGHSPLAQMEATQVAAMAVRYIFDCTNMSTL